MDGLPCMTLYKNECNFIQIIISNTNEEKFISSVISFHAVDDLIYSKARQFLEDIVKIHEYTYLHENLMFQAATT